jgi:hypothetical protein
VILGEAQLFLDSTIPADSTPRIFDAFSAIRSPVCPLIRTAPSSPKATFCPAATFGAPQTTVCVRSPVETVASRSRSAFGCGSTRSTSPTRTFSPHSPSRIISSTSVALSVIRRANTSGERSIST